MSDIVIDTCLKRRSREREGERERERKKYNETRKIQKIVKKKKLENHVILNKKQEKNFKKNTFKNILKKF